MDQFNQNVILLDKYYASIVTSLIHKSAFEKYGPLDESIDFVWDYELWLRLSLEHGFHFHLLPKILSKYRFHPEQQTKLMQKYHPNDSEDIKKFVLKKLKNNERKKYENALKQYRKRIYPNTYPFLSRKTKWAIDKFVLKTLSPSSAKKVSNLYRTITGKKKS